MTDREQQLHNVFRRGILDKPQIDQWLKDLRGNPSPRESGFDVTVVGNARIGDDTGYNFAGVNAEQIHHRLGVHGEDGLIAAMTTGLGKFAFLSGVDVMAAPRGLVAPTDSPMGDIDVPCCGKCRQNVFERAYSLDIPVRAISLNGNHENINTIGNLLKGAFSFSDFNPDLIAAKQGTADIKAPTDDVVANRLMRFEPQTDGQVFDWLKDLQSAAFASGIEQNVVIRLKDGTYVGGVKCEDAAYTGLSGMQSATAIAITADGYHTGREIEEVWLMARDNKGKILTPDMMQALPLSDAQILLEFGAKLGTPIHIFNAKGEHTDVSLAQMPYFAPTFDAQGFSSDTTALTEATALAKCNVLSETTVANFEKALLNTHMTSAAEFIGIGKKPLEVATVTLRVDVSHYPDDIRRDVPQHVRMVVTDYLRALQVHAPHHTHFPDHAPLLFSSVSSTDVRPNGTMDITFKADHLQMLSYLHSIGYTPAWATRFLAQRDSGTPALPQQIRALP